MGIGRQRGGDVFGSTSNGSRGERRGGKSGCSGWIKDGEGVVVEPHRHAGVFNAKGEQYALCTKSLVAGELVYGENRVVVQNEDGTKVEYRLWDPFKSKLAAAILDDVYDIGIIPGDQVLYLGAGSGITVSHVSDIVGPMGMVYAVEFSDRKARDLINMARKRTNVIPIIEDARHPLKYQSLVGVVDVVISDISQPYQVKILAQNASYFLKEDGRFMISVNANRVDPTAPADVVFAQEIIKLYAEQFRPMDEATLEPFTRDHSCIFGGYRILNKQRRAN
ncbi:rRNA 2'-O-methyltransferase fibrillarin 1-like [Dioscorea cayenensis subsp. rotundata]|uniref:rRNA 2'-O-methyltransferase fibrillarin 1-like n=1 Tax=Dioscorea cayennensis subsp. rotundata TaxID=55577 RepID=A0AB40C435_DIOCR|nr:rRNA 2'-O-methyltransferase fibrillarin 1-like [Dioscorea cayenensis subsp. rotundata]